MTYEWTNPNHEPIMFSNHDPAGAFFRDNTAKINTDCCRRHHRVPGDPNRSVMGSRDLTEL